VVTIKDIAENLGVAASTVGRALSQDSRISAATRARVAQAAQDLGYVAHSAARQMRSQRSLLVGLVIPDVLNAFYSTAAQAISRSFDEAGYQTVLSISEDKPEVELRQVRSLAEARVDAIVWVPTVKPLAQTVTYMQAITHVQLIRRCSRLRSDWFGIDDVATTCQATEHLLELGHQRIAYVGGPRSLSTGESRLKGFVLAHEAHARSVDESLIFCDAPDARSGPQVLDRLLSLAPTAIVVATSRGTESVIEGLSARGVKVPEQISVVGFNDSPAVSWWGPGLTTMRLPVREVSMASVDFLVRKMAQGRPDPAAVVGQMTQYPPALVARGSTAAPAGVQPFGAT
jgi:LacI family transcriptional regulator